MYRITFSIVGLVMAIATIGAAQEPQLKQDIPENAFGTRELVAWTSLQQPHPTPQPLPSPDATVPQPGSAEQPPKPPATPQNPESPIQSFTGKIVKDGARYVLKGNSTYQLEQRVDFSRYEDQNVKVTGSLVASTNCIQILEIALVS